MLPDPQGEELIVGVAGAGAMGRGIAQVAATGGCNVKLYDTRSETAREAVEFIQSMVARAAEKGRMSEEEAEAASRRIEIVDSLSGFAPCDVVIEAVVENLDVKHKVFAELESIVGEDIILASNTSSLSVTSIASATQHPERVAGFHFFNPVPVMKLVEVIDGVRTAPGIADFLIGLGKRMGRVPVRVADAPGFLVNQVGRGFTIEAAHLVGEGIAQFVDVDRIMRDAAGFRMGPFELMDLTAIDVTHPATELTYRQHFDEPRYRPSVLMKTRLEAGLLGRKVGTGFYSYESGQQDVPEEAPAPGYDDRPVWISQAEPDGYRMLSDRIGELGAPVDDGAAPGDDALIIVTPLGLDATAACLNEELDPTRTVAVDTLFGLSRRQTVMKTPLTAPDFADAAYGLLAGDGTPVTVIHDSPGFVTQRIVALIVNIGCAVAQARTATPEDIDKAVTLGLRYPYGPLAFGDALGPSKILQVLTAIHQLTGDPRYRPTPWLRRRAELGISLLTPES